MICSMDEVSGKACMLHVDGQSASREGINCPSSYLPTYLNTKTASINILNCFLRKKESSSKCLPPSASIIPPRAPSPKPTKHPPDSHAPPISSPLATGQPLSPAAVVALGLSSPAPCSKLAVTSSVSIFTLPLASPNGADCRNRPQLAGCRHVTSNAILQTRRAQRRCWSRSRLRVQSGASHCED